jgi:hypothetical protein
MKIRSISCRSMGCHRATFDMLYLFSVYLYLVILHHQDTEQFEWKMEAAVAEKKIGIYF